jgi:hypothetical protein
MRNFNLIRPLLIVLVAIFTKNLVEFICIISGFSKEIAENLGYLGMIIAAVVVFVRLNRRRNS